MTENQGKKESPARSKTVRADGEGKTTSEAYAKAMASLEAQVGEFDVEDVDVAVISEGSKGFLGMGSTVARVEVSITVEGDAGEEEPGDDGTFDAGPEISGRLEAYLGEVLSGIGIEADIRIADRGEEVIANVEGDDLGLFIGRHGQTMDAVQYLANVIIFRNVENRKRIVIDAEDYRGRRTEILHGLADRGAKEVSQGRRQYELKPMSAAERRIVHVYLQDREGIQTASDGREPFRHVVITRSE
ncbi:MAG: RNA-binding cell elongation regulator Jag/EloR [Thermoleophilia bacterium]